MRTLTLNGSWLLSKQGERQALSASVPGTVHECLLDNGKIADPYLRDNELAAQWVGEATWEYKKSFEVTKQLLIAQTVLLRFEGLDTLAEVTLNGKQVAQTSNMHRVYEFDVRSLLKVGKNEIKVSFAPALRYLEEKDKTKPPMYGWTGARLHNAGWLRKEPCNFGWDWGPKLLTAGIWRDVSLLALDAGRIVDVSVRQRHVRGKVSCQVSVSAEVAPGNELFVQLTLKRGDKLVASRKLPLTGSMATTTLDVGQPELWWPNGLGDQPLYELDVDLVDPAGSTQHSQSRRLGLRTLSLRTRGDKFGESFEFVVNGVAFFAKGANWIPADTFAPRVSHEDYERLLGDAKDANMNMLRVWGGGIYESDSFYELCDELGLCVWQDFMFACGTYPAFDKAFMQEVKFEAQDNVRRLRHHACLALFCGNNEIEQGLVGPAWTPNTMSWRDYDKLFNALLPEVVQQLAPDISYWPGSPHTPGKGRADFDNPDRGDAHLWGVWHGKQPFEWYRECQHRFVSEFGFQSFPHPRTVKAYTDPPDRNITSWVMEHHQRSHIGNTTIIHHMTEWFLMPKDFEATLWLSQIQQGMAMKFATEHFRRNMPRSMGALYWQLNDCWPVASWSSIDSFGRRKALHYMARHFFAPCLVSGVENLDAGEVAVFVSNDRREALKGNVDYLVTTAGGKKLASGTLAVRVAAGTSQRVGAVQVSKFLEGRSARDVLVWLDLKRGSTTLSKNLVMFSRPKHLLLEEPQIAAQVSEKAGVYIIKVRSKKTALWCWLDLKDADVELEDNFFHLRPGQVVTLRARHKKRLAAEAFAKKLVIRHLGTTHC